MLFAIKRGEISRALVRKVELKIFLNYNNNYNNYLIKNVAHITFFILSFLFFFLSENCIYKCAAFVMLLLSARKGLKK